MRANPGGVIDPKDVVGRDKLIARLWGILDGQSVVLTAERRIGKSCVINKMCAEAPNGIVTIYRDLEGTRIPLEFVEKVYHDAFDLLSKTKKGLGLARALVQQFEGFEIGGKVKFPESMAPHWKAFFEKTIKDLMENQKGKVVFFWDELPLMLHDIARSSGDTVAMELLDTLRALRQTHGERLRMVFTGSIGLHHVTSALTEAGHANPATNDMNKVEVPPLEPEDAEDLATKLIEGESLRCEDQGETARSIAHLVDCIPFYIHHVVSTMKGRGDTASPELADEIVAAALVADQDPWNLEHYVKRVEIYYGPDRKPVILAILDELAAEDGTLSVDTLHGRLKAKRFPESSQTGAQILSGDRETLLGLLTPLKNDHYIMQHPDDGAYAFRFPLIKRWWRASRGLA